MREISKRGTELQDAIDELSMWEGVEFAEHWAENEGRVVARCDVDGVISYLRQKGFDVDVKNDLTYEDGSYRGTPIKFEL